MTAPALNALCPSCSAVLAPSLLACPACGALVYGPRLQALADVARAAALRGDVSGELAVWREAIELLPAGSRQYQVIAGKIQQLSRSAQESPAIVRQPSRDASSAAGKAAAGLGGLGLLLWKLKFFVILVLTKGKLLLLGLTKSTTLFSMLLSLGVYWSVWGWKFALGLVLSIYVHEMGHVIALQRLGFRATAPMFIPGLGALIRLQQHPANPREDAIIGLAGPLYGLGAAIASLGLWAVFRDPFFAALAGIGAWINLFNLLPVWTLDGGRAFHALSRNQKWLAAAVIGATWVFTREPLLVLLLIAAAYHAVSVRGNEEGDRRALTTYIALVIVLSTMCLIRESSAVPRPRPVHQASVRSPIASAISSAMCLTRVSIPRR